MPETVTQKQLYELQQQTNAAVNSLQNDVTNRLNGLNDKIDAKYPTRSEFSAELEPLKRLIWGTVAAVTTGFIGALFLLISRGGK